MKRRTALRSNPEKVRDWERRSRRELPKTSRRQRRFDREFAAAKPAVAERSGGFCEAQLPGICWGFATEFHHVAGRKCPDANQRLLHLCWRCHFAITNHEVDVYGLGLLAHTSSPAGSTAPPFPAPHSVCPTADAPAGRSYTTHEIGDRR